MRREWVWVGLRLLHHWTEHITGALLDVGARWVLMWNSVPCDIRLAALMAVAPGVNAGFMPNAAEVDDLVARILAFRCLVWVDETVAPGTDDSQWLDVHSGAKRARERECLLLSGIGRHIPIRALLIEVSRFAFAHPIAHSDAKFRPRLGRRHVGVTPGGGERH